MSKPRIDDLVVVLPGIGGSVLQKAGRDVWATSGSALWGAVKTLGRSIETLTLGEDDPERETLDDGVIADRLVADLHILPGIARIDGYSRLTRMITDRFEVIPGTRDDPTPANFFTFPYDWRRDNRVAAEALSRFIETKLAIWREHTNLATAKVILLAHSMGGLVSRHYLEVLGGWEHARALITFGTPFRGSPQALRTLSRGMKKGWLDLGDMLRSFTSVYQLMPIYPVVESGGEHHRIAELPGIPNIDLARAQAALQFHRDIESAVAANGHDAYVTLPFLGFRQSTLQSARLVGSELTVDDTTPEWIDPRLGGGDGTVPLVSAIPIELSDDMRDTYIAERHSSLQGNRRVLDDVSQRLRRLAASGLSAIRGPQLSPDRAEEPAIGIGLDDLYAAGEPVVISAALHHVDAGRPPRASVASAGGRIAPMQLDFVPDGDAWALQIEGLPAGAYRVEVSLGASGPSDPDPVHDVFEVLP